MVKRPFDGKLLEVLHVLATHNSVLKPAEITRILNSGGRRVSERTVLRWLGSIRRHGFKYFPNPRFESFDMRFTMVSAHGVRDWRIFDTIPYRMNATEGFDFHNNMESALAFYAVPAEHAGAFGRFWRAAKRSGLAENIEVMPLKSITNIYSPFHKILDRNGNFAGAGISPDESAEMLELLRKNIAYSRRPAMHPLIAERPLLLPIAFEMYRNFLTLSDLSKSLGRHVGGNIKYYSPGRKVTTSALRDNLAFFHSNLGQFFQQIKVIYDPLYPRNITLHMILDLKKGADLVELAREISRFSIKTIVQPAVEPGKVLIYILTNQDNLSKILMQVLPRFPVNEKNTHYIWQSYEESKKKFWRTPEDVRPFRYYNCFDPVKMRWKYDRAAYMDALEQLATQQRKKDE